ncbi:MAG TPA: peptidylprolyl isomerase [Chitinophagales bacterium]|nr:peptidylprolyl isomerase [Chitinophagales bacterium]
MKAIQSIVFGLLFLAVPGVVLAQAQLLDKVVAVVGDNIIMQSDIEAQYQQAVANNQGQPPVPSMRCMIFDNMLLDKLFLSQAQLDSITVTTDEVDAELDRRIKYFISVFGSKEKLEEYYGKSILELKDDFKEDIEKQLISDKMKAKAFKDLKVSPAEVEAYFKKIPADSIPYFNSEEELGEIVMFPKVTQEEKDFARKKIEGIRKEILEGADFSVKAIQYSEDPGSYLDGGSLGVIQRGELVPEFEAVAFKLKEGEMSDVVETPFGYHLIIVDEKRGDKLKVRHILIRPKTTQADMNTVKDRMDSIVHELRVDSLNWGDAVKKFSDDEQSKSVGGLMTNQKTGTQFFEKADVEGTLIFTLDKMKVGDYSDPLPYSSIDKTGETKKGYRIIWLKSETKPHKASLETDYAKIQAAAKTEKQQEALENWIKLHRSNNFVHIDSSMYGCPQVQKWIE